MTCPECQGNGAYGHVWPCPACNGSGFTYCCEGCGDPSPADPTFRTMTVEDAHIILGTVNPNGDGTRPEPERA